jgi:tight adherence protein B
VGAVRAALVAVIGSTFVFVLARAARRYEIADRISGPARTRHLPSPVRRPLARALAAAGVDTAPEQVVQLWLLGAVVVGGVGAAVVGSAAVVPTALVIVGGPVALRLARGRESRRIAAAVPEFLERVASELRAGGTIATALDTAADSDGPLVADLGRVRSRVLLGASLEASLHAWPEERPIPGVDAAAGALALCSVTGGGSATSLDGLASSLRERLGVVAEARALSSQARMSALVIGLAPVCYLACSAVIDPASAHLLLGTGPGRLCAVVGLGLEVVGALWMRRIVASGECS